MDANLDADAHVRRIVAIHFDPVGGAPYWLERAREFSFDARTEIRSVVDLERLGTLHAAALCERTVLDFVPLSRRGGLAGAIITETGGTTGLPKRTIFSVDEFRAAFVAPFVTVADAAGFPRGGLWLWVGPSGPHVIGQAAAACAAAMGSPHPFAVDFDPRWFRRLPPDSLARERYLHHIIEQARQIVAHEPISVIFTTPVVLERLAALMTRAQRDLIRGVHYGGMRVAPELLRNAQAQWFPYAVHLAGYGNSLFGVCMEFGGAPDRPLRYYPQGPRLVLRTDAEVVWMSRLDETVLIANLRERDTARPVPPPKSAPGGPYGWGIENPGPRATPASPVDVGIY